VAHLSGGTNQRRNRKSKATRVKGSARRLLIESLEQRQYLSATPVDVTTFVPLNDEVAQVAARVAVQTAAGAQWYVSPTGSAQGDGSLAHPWDLKTALGDNTKSTSPNRAIQPGDTVWVLGGTYAGDLYSTLTGTADKPIIVRNYQGQRATIDHPQGTGLTVGGSYVWFWGLEFTSSNPDRYSDQTGSWPSDIPYRDAVYVKDPTGVKFINSVVHEGGNGFALWSPGVDTEVSGSLVYYVGWYAPDRSHSHGFYTQNTTGTKRILDNIVFDNANHGMQIYGSSASYVDNFDVEGNVLFNNGELFGGLDGRNLLMGGGHSARNDKLIGNLLYRDPSKFGLTSSDLMLGMATGMQDSVVRDNYVVGPTYLSGSFSNVDISDNTFYGNMASDAPVRDVKGTYPDNTYLTSRPTGTRIFVNPNEYEAGRANVTVYNWDLHTTVRVDLAGIGLNIGDRYELRNSQDFYNDVIVGTYTGDPIVVPMTGHSVASPVALAAPATTFPQFGSFVVTKAGGSTSPTPTNAAPTLTAVGSLSGAVEDTSYTISYAALAAASNAADAEGDALSFRVEGVTSGTLAKGGTPVTAGSTLLGPDESLVWTPAANAQGQLAAFTVRAWDGQNVSATPVQVLVDVAAVNDCPTLTSIEAFSGATAGTPWTISYSTLANAANATDADGDTVSFRVAAVVNGTLTKDGVSVTAGSTMLSPGQSLVWTPATSAQGTQCAFKVVACDGQTTSSNPVAVDVAVASAVAPEVSVRGPVDGFRGVRGQVRQFELATSNASGAVAYRVNWGDGSAVENVSAGSGSAVLAGHTYVNTGRYTMTVTASDAAGRTTAAKSLTLDILTSEQQASRLAVGGTANNDTFQLTQTGGPGSYTGVLNNVSLGKLAAPLTGVDWYGQAGRDVGFVYGSANADVMRFDETGLVLNGVPVVANSIEGWYLYGQGGLDTLQGPDANNTWQFTTQNCGTLNGSVNYSAIESLTGGSRDDTFRLRSTAAVAGRIDGGSGGRNTLDYSYVTAALTVDLQRGTAGLTGGIANINGIKGAGGNLKLIAPDTDNQWNLVGTRSGDINDGLIVFSNVGPLVGGSQTDVFRFAGNASTFTALDGADGSDTLDMSAFTTAQWVNLASRASSKVSTLANFESLRGNHVTGSTLIAGNTINDWVLDGANAGSVNGVQFVGFTDLTGGTARDVFHVLPEARVAGRVNGVGSENTLDFSRYGTAGITVDLGNGITSTGVARIANFRIVIGSDGNDTLKSGSVGSLMLGGGGDDSLLGAGGRDIFLGGRGADVLKGGYGEDLLFGGATSYYDEAGTKSIDLNALETLLRLWGSGSSYATRMSQLLGGTSAVKLSAATLVDDVAAADVLFGGLGTGSDSTPDWFLKNAEDQSDRIGDLNSRIDKTTVL
jgi:hypothetical protein